MKYLQPLTLRPTYYARIEAEIKKLFFKTIYADIVRAIRVPKSEITNAIDDALYKAVADGRVEYDGQLFTGKFTAAISKRLRDIGAVWRKTGWHLSPEFMPAEISMALAHADSRYQAIASSLIKTLDTVDVDKAFQDSAIKGSYFKTTGEMNADFLKTLGSATIAPELTVVARQIIAQQWGTNLQLYIKDWMQQNILKLRQQVQANAFAGNRAAKLVKVIQANYGVSQNKAKFLARQETSLLMSKMREQRYTDIGSQTYRWSGSMDARERPDHKALEGKIFRWDSPPVVDKNTGMRAHPGEDFNCRCVAIPIIE